MTVCSVSTVVAACGAGDVTFNSVSTSGTSEECIADISGGGAVDLIVLSDNGEVTVTVMGGDGPTAIGDRTYAVKSGCCKSITVPTGEARCADGKLRFTIGAKSALDVRVAVIRRLNVVTH